MSRSEFELFIKEQQEPLRRFLLNLSGGNHTLSDDVAQEAFIKAYLGLSTFQGRSKMSTWLFKIAYNCFYDVIRKNKFETENGLHDIEKLKSSLIDDGYSADESFKDQELYIALSHLKEQEKAIILLFYMEDKNIKEISAITGIEQNTVKSHLSRGRAHLKDYLTTIGYEYKR